MKLSDVCVINPKSQDINDSTPISFIAMPDVSEDGRINTSVIRSFGEVKRGYTTFQEGDVLFAKITPCMENGKGAQALGLKNGIGVGSTEFHVLRPIPDKIDGKWLYYLTAWPAFRHEAEIHMTGSAGQKRVPKSFLESYQIGIPTLIEQKDQVSHLNRIRKIIESRQRQLHTLDTLIKARFVEMTESSTTVRVRMGDVATYINGYAFKPTDWTTEGLPIIRIQNLNDKTAPYNHYSGTVDSKYRVYSGDILVSWATHLEAYVWEGGDAWLNQHIFRVIFDKMPINKIYFVYSTEEALRQAFRNAHGFKPTMEHIKRSDFEDAVIELPPIGVQDQFAVFVSQVDKSKLAVQEALDKAQLLFDSLMQQYFG
ncbi:MAG: restriction endonuclease subunit S [Clostridia bacterium]|nr:restriction endonuclease subunit S [Clostridia bacterium]